MRSDEISNDYIIKYQLANEKWRIYDALTKEITTCDKPPLNRNKFDMLGGNEREAEDEYLIAYAKDFKKWNRELRFNRICSIEYSKSYCDYMAASKTFNKFCLNKYKNHDVISTTEYNWFEKCANGSQQYLNPKYIDKEKQCYGYDYKSYYALIMNSDLLIPSKVGKEYNLKKLSKKLKHGFYRVKVSCNDDNFKKIFTFSKHNVYLNISLEVALLYQTKYDVKIELIIDDKPNAYLYRTKDMVSLNSICGTWFSKLFELKLAYPNNRLLKYLISSVWGVMSKSNITYMDLEELQACTKKIGSKYSEDADWIILEQNFDETNTFFKLLNAKNPYKFNIRLKPFITAFGRNVIAKLALVVGLKRIIRIHTDCLVLDSPYDFKDENLIAESKTTGLITFQNCNSYHNLTENYKTKSFKNGA